MTKFDELEGTINHTQGDSLELLFDEVKEDDSLIDWSGWDAELRIELKPPDENPLLTLSKANGGINLNVTGELRVLASAESMSLPPKTYYYSLKMTRPNGKIETWLRARKFIIQEV